MFRRSRKRIVSAIMSVLVLLWVGTLCVIYTSSYLEVSERNRKMLEQYVALYSIEPPIVGNIPIADEPMPNIKDHHLNDTPVFQLSTFYSVAVSYNSEIIAVKNEGAVYDNSELEEIALSILKKGKESGIKSNLIYHMSDKGGYILVAFMDNTVIKESMTTLFRYTLIFGAAAIVALYFLAAYLAKRIVAPLEESYQKQKQFISDAGHELKTPVSVISANAELLSREIGKNQWLDNIQYENGRMGVLIAQLLSLAKTENVTPQMQKLDFSRLVSGEALPFESVIFEEGLLLSCEISDGLLINGNEGQLKQLVSILLDNAIRHGSGGKNIDLILKEERGNAKLSVINCGKEIPEEQRKQLFERFYRMDMARSNNGGHYGLGLSIAKSIVASHSGKINVKCYDGKVDFTVSIPLQR